MSDKRSSIMDAALLLFADRGFYGTPVPLIAERAGVGTGTIYRYFENKEKLVNELYRHWKRELARVMGDRLPIYFSPREIFHEVWVRRLQFAREHPKAMAFLFLHHHFPYLDEENIALDDSYIAPVRAFYSRARAERIVGELDADVIITIVWGVFLEMLRVSWEGKIPLTDEIAEQFEDAAWRAISAG